MSHTHHPTLSYTSSNKVATPVADLKIGMYVAALDRPWAETPFLFQGFTIETEHDIEVLQEYCTAVTVDVQSSVDFQIAPRRPGKSGTRGRTTAVRKRSTSVEQTLGRAQRTYDASSKLVRDILMSSGGSTLKALDVAHAHHERIDGTGYPRGLVGDQMTRYSRMVAITDTFDAITSDRVYDNARTNMDAFRILSQGRNTQWDGNLVVRFVSAIGIYPAGTAVELSNQMLGVVIETHPTLKLRPKIVLTHSQGGPLAPPVLVNLAAQKTDERGEPLNVVKVLKPSVAGISLHRLRDQGLLDDLQNLPDFRQVFLAARQPGPAVNPPTRPR